MSDQRLTQKRRRLLRAMGGLAAVGAMAGCGTDDSGGNGNGGNGNGGNGDDMAGNGNGDGSGSAVWQPFAFTESGTFQWEIDAQENQFEGLTMTVESVSGDSATVTASMDLGGATQSTTVSGTPNEIRQQLTSSVAGALLSTTYLAPPLAQSQGQRFTVEDEWTVQAGGDTATMRVTGEDSYSGLSCKAWEYSLNEQVRMEGCVDVDQGLALYFETYDESGNSEFRMELVHYSSEPGDTVDIGGGTDGGDSDGGDSDGTDGDGTDGDGTDDDSDTGDSSGAVWQPFDFDEAGTYEWDITDSDGQIDSLTLTIESVSGDTATVTASIDLGGVTQETTVSGTPSQVRDQLSTSVAGALLSTTYLAPPLAQSQGRAFTVGNDWTVQAGGDTATMRVTGQDTFAGVSCKAWQYSLNGQVRMEGCVNTEQGLALYFETYDDSGNSEFRMELVDYSPA